MEKNKHKWVIRRHLEGMPIRKISAHLQMSERTIYRTLSYYKKFGETIEPNDAGRPRIEIHPNCKELIKAEWHKYQCGSVKLHKITTEKGIGISQRKIQEILDEYSLSAPCPKRRGQRKYCSYRWPEGYFVLHTDWSVCPFSNKQIIAYLDDYSRYIVGYGLYEKATTENALACLYSILFKYGMPYAIITDRGSCFYANKQNKKGDGKSKFQETLEDLGIKHIVGKPHHPQTNGKIERWFGTYKREFNNRFNNLNEYIKFYNEKRPHQRLKYKVPASIFFKEKTLTHFGITAKIDEEKNDDFKNMS